MNNEFVLSCAAGKNNKVSSETEKVLNNIMKIKEKMVAMGYSPSEVDYIIMKYSNNSKITEIELKKLREVEAALKNHMDIALKCMGVR